jgi:hypothetical protein
MTPKNIVAEYEQLQKEAKAAADKVAAKFMETFQFSPHKVGDRIKPQDSEFIIAEIEPHIHTWSQPPILSFTYQGFKIKKDGTPSLAKQNIYGYSQRIEL